VYAQFTGAVTPLSKYSLLLCRSSASLPVFYLTRPADRILTLGCPGARPNMAVAWDRGVEPIYRSEHLAGRDLSGPPPRLLIDTGHHLLFQPAKAQDSGISCLITVMNHSCVTQSIHLL